MVNHSIQTEISNKVKQGCASGILNSPDLSFSPETDTALLLNYDKDNHVDGKNANKLYLQKKLDLIQNSHAPLLFWPSRLDRVQNGSQLFATILYDVVSKYWDQYMEIVFIADGEFQNTMREIVENFNLKNRVAVCRFDETLWHLSYGASDFILMPSAFEPGCLPQMIGPLYGSLPIAHNTGAIHDTIDQLDIDNNTGNGFLFSQFNSNGLYQAIDEAMAFYCIPRSVKDCQIKRIMEQSYARFNYSITAAYFHQCCMAAGFQSIPFFLKGIDWIVLFYKF